MTAHTRGTLQGQEVAGLDGFDGAVAAGAAATGAAAAGPGAGAGVTAGAVGAWRSPSPHCDEDAVGAGCVGCFLKIGEPPGHAEQ